MGAYFYVTSPKLTAKARVLRADTTVEIIEIALYRYAYKPYSGWSDYDRKMNRKMHMNSGAMACEGAYKRSAKSVPEFGICYDAEGATLYPLTGRDATRTPFRTRGLAGGLDDYEFSNYDGTPEILAMGRTAEKGLTVREPVGEVMA